MWRKAIGRVVYAAIVGSRAWVWKIMNGCECCTNVCNPQDNDTDYNMGIIVSVPGERVPRKRYPYSGVPTYHAYNKHYTLAFPLKK